MTKPFAGYSSTEFSERWSDYLASRSDISEVDLVELNNRLLDQVTGLESGGLSHNEAFMVSMLRVGVFDDFNQYLQAVPDQQHKSKQVPSANQPLLVTAGFALLAGIVSWLTFSTLFKFTTESDYLTDSDYLLLGMSGLAVVIAGYFSWLNRQANVMLLAAFVSFLVVLFIVHRGYAWVAPEHTRILFFLHIPIVLAVVLGVFYLGSAWRQTIKWIDYLRFLGEFFIYYTLISLGLLLILVITGQVFYSVGFNSRFLLETASPILYGSGTVIAIWFAKVKQSVAEIIAPVLTMIFATLFAVSLLTFIILIAVTNNWFNLDRDILVTADLALIFIWAVFVFSISARKPSQSKVLDWIQIISLTSALLADLIVLVGILTRSSEFGFTPNQVAALGQSLLLLINLAVSLVIYLRFIAGKKVFTALERWQCSYIPVIGFWALLVSLVLPVIFGFR